MRSKIIIYLSVLELLITGCAASFKTIHLNALNYTNTQNCNNKLEVSYINDVYTLNKNHRYAKKEKRNNYATIAIRIKNLTDSSRMITNGNFRIYVNDNKLAIEDKTQYFRKVSQVPETHLLHVFWGFFVDYNIYRIDKSLWEEGNAHVKFKPCMTMIALTVGMANTIIATIANEKHENYINENEIFGKIIKPGETIYGIIILNNPNYDPLVFRYLDK